MFLYFVFQQFGPHLLKSSNERRKSGTDLKERVLQTSPLVNIFNQENYI